MTILTRKLLLSTGMRLTKSQTKSTTFPQLSQKLFAKLGSPAHTSDELSSTKVKSTWGSMQSRERKLGGAGHTSTGKSKHGTMTSTTTQMSNGQKQVFGCEWIIPTTIVIIRDTESMNFACMWQQTANDPYPMLRKYIYIYILWWSTKSIYTGTRQAWNYDVKKVSVNT